MGARRWAALALVRGVAFVLVVSVGTPLVLFDYLATVLAMAATGPLT